MAFLTEILCELTTETVTIFNIVNHNNTCKEVGVQRVFTSLKLVDIMSIKRNWLVVMTSFVCS